MSCVDELLFAEVCCTLGNEAVPKFESIGDVFAFVVLINAVGLPSFDPVVRVSTTFDGVERSDVVWPGGDDDDDDNDAVGGNVNTSRVVDTNAAVPSPPVVVCTWLLAHQPGGAPRTASSLTNMILPCPLVVSPYTITMVDAEQCIRSEGTGACIKYKFCATATNRKYELIFFFQNCQLLKLT